jgi:hypothetical protein
MKGRHFQKQEFLDPAYVALKPSFGKVPKVHMHYRTEEAGKFFPPGPNYMPPAFGLHGIKIGFAPHGMASTARPKSEGGERVGTALGRRGGSDVTPGPGPGKYYLRREDFEQNGKRGLAIMGHHDFDYDKIHTPGPSTYRPHYDKILPSAPKYLIKHQYKEKGRETRPGYRNFKSTLAGPKYTMKARATDEIELI